MNTIQSEDHFYDDLEQTFDAEVMKIIEHYLPENWETAPLYYYFKIVEIRKFRSGLPALLASSEGLNREAALKIGAAAELLFCASLILDDIIDEDTVRSKHPAAHIKYDIPTIILCAHLAFATADIMICSIEELKVISWERLNKMRKLFSVSNTQLMKSCLFERRYAKEWVNGEDYLRVLKYKTSTGSIALAAMGLLDEAKEDFSAALLEIGYQLGIAGQIKNDIFDFTILYEARNKVSSDMKNGYLTYPLLKLKEIKPALSKDIISLMEQQQDEAILELLQAHDIFHQCKQDIATHIEKAIQIIADLPINNTSKELLKFWANCNNLKSIHTARTGIKKH